MVIGVYGGNLRFCASGQLYPEWSGGKLAPLEWPLSYSDSEDSLSGQGRARAQAFPEALLV